jgi:hypothetical protein
MAAPHLAQQGDRPQAGVGHQYRHDLAVPVVPQRVRTSPSARCLLL